MKTVALLFVSTMLALIGCKNSADRPGPGSATAVTTEPDRVQVLARHRSIASKEDLDSDPVIVRFEKFAVTKARFDAQNLEGGTATVELDLTSIKSGNEERDTDLKAPEFFDVAKFATVTIDVGNVKKQGSASYTADATVASTTAETVRIKGEYAFSRLDFAIGIDPAEDPTERIDTALVIQWTLTLKKT